MLVLSATFISCKWDRKADVVVEEKILVNGAKAPMLNIDITEAPEKEDNGNYIPTEEGMPVSLTYEGIEKDDISWLVDGYAIGKGATLSHTFTTSGIKEVKASLSNGEERIVYVMVTDKQEAEPVSDPNPSSNVTPDGSTPSKPIIADRDRDGVPDASDECPDQRGDKANRGCPWPDSDGDGIPDHKDKCPNEAGVVKYKGCKPPEATDRDGDGVPDSKDKCPDAPGAAQNGGCPPPPKDSDGDGITDSEDACPKVKGVKEWNGCPPPPPSDSDGDGIADKDDKCPNEKGTKEHGGCLPPPPPVVFVPKSSSTLGGLASQAALEDEKGTSSSGSITIKPSQDLILHEAKLVASGHGKIDISIEGGDIKKEVSITKNVNPGNNTIRMNDFKNTVLRAGKTYTLIYQTQGDVQVTQIKNAYASGCADSRVTISGKNIFYDIIYKY
jgi:hypothetical protein